MVNPAADMYLKSLDYNASSRSLINAEAYVSHPINAFHLMKRAASW